MTKLRQKLQICPSHVIRARKCVRALIKYSYYSYSIRQQMCKYRYLLQGRRAYFVKSIRQRTNDVRVTNLQCLSDIFDFTDFYK